MANKYLSQSENNAVYAARAALTKSASASPGMSLDQVRASALQFLAARHSNTKTASQQIPLAANIMYKIASRDTAGLRVLCALDGLNKLAAEGEKGASKPFITQDTKDAYKNLWESIEGGFRDAGKWISDTAQEGVNGAAQWFADPTHLAQLGIGLGTGAGLYGLSWLLPNARHTHGLRLLASILAGAGAGYYGDNIINWARGDGFRSDKELADLRRTFLPEDPELQDPNNPEVVKNTQLKGASGKNAAIAAIFAHHAGRQREA